MREVGIYIHIPFAKVNAYIVILIHFVIKIHT